MRIGRLRRCEAVAQEYYALATADEEAARVLWEHGKARHAMYFLLQAMEKFVRAKIYTIVNPKLAVVREKNRSHSVESAIDFLLEVLTSVHLAREQVRAQICNRILGGVRFSQLHNDLRYPFYSTKSEDFSLV